MKKAAELDEDLEDDLDIDLDSEEDDDVVAPSSDEDEDEDEDEDDWSVEDDDEDEEMAEFSEKQRAVIKKKLQRLEEDREEAIRFANEQLSQRARAEQQLRQASKTTVHSIKGAVEQELNDLKRQYAEALETDDHEAAAEVNLRIADAVNRKRVADAASEEIEREPEADSGDASVPAIRQRWYAKNPWFDPSGQGGDSDKTAIALVGHREAIGKGLKPDTPEYFQHIDEKVGRMFGKPKQQEKRRPQPKDGPPPVRRGRSEAAPGRKTFRMTESMRRVAKTLGLSDQEYAKAYLEYEKDNH